MSRVKLGLADIFRAALEAHDQIGGPTLGAAVLAIVRERPRLRSIIDDMRAGIERLKAARDVADDQGALARQAFNDTIAILAEAERQRDHYRTNLHARSEEVDALLRVRDDLNRQLVAAADELAEVKAQLGQACAAGEALVRERDEALADLEAALRSGSAPTA